MAEDLPEYTKSVGNIPVDPEWVIAQNPDFIAVHVVLEEGGSYGVDDTSEMAELRESIMNRPELANANAVKTGNVYIMCDTFRNDATGGLTGASYMAKWFHPELFEDLEPNEIHREFLREWLKTQYDLGEHGVFVYHPEKHPEGK